MPKRGVTSPAQFVDSAESLGKFVQDLCYRINDTDYSSLGIALYIDLEGNNLCRHGSVSFWQSSSASGSWVMMIIGRARTTPRSPYIPSILRRSGCRRLTRSRQNAHKNMRMRIHCLVVSALWRRFLSPQTQLKYSLTSATTLKPSLPTSASTFAARWVSSSWRTSSAIIVMRTYD